MSKDNWDDSSDDEGDAPPDPLFKGNSPPDPRFKGNSPSDPLFKGDAICSACKDMGNICSACYNKGVRSIPIKEDLLRFSLYKPEDVAPSETNKEYTNEYDEADQEEGGVGGYPPEEGGVGGYPPEEGGYPQDYESDEYDDYEDAIDKKLGRYVSYR